MNSFRISRQLLILLFAISLADLTGCSLISRRYAGPNPDGTDVVMQNPTVVPVNGDMEFAWNQIVDMVDDYFDIASERQIREIHDVLMEGTIVTQPKTGATCTEFLMRDSTPGYERLHATLQSIRRTATLRVIPTGNGLQVFVEVIKELEDVSRPEYSTVSSNVMRHDGSLIAFDDFDRSVGPTTLGWVTLGRDDSLEQAMLRNLHARMHQTVELPPVQ